MNKKFFSREVKIGILVIAAILIGYFGLNFLKGVDIFSPVNYYYADYNNIDGLVPSSPVLIKGFKVGQVEAVNYDFSKDNSFRVKISVSKDIRIPKSASLQLFDNGLMGGKALQLVFDPALTNNQYYAPAETLRSEVALGLMAQLSGDLMPKIENILFEVDTLLKSVRKITDGEELNQSLSAIKTTTTQLAQTSTQLNRMMSKDVPLLLSDVKVLTSDFKVVSGNLKNIDFAQTIASVNQTIANLNLITDNINKGEGTVGMLLKDKNLYINLSNTAASADRLLIDLKEHPKRYVHFSLFGKKTEQK